MRPEKYALTEAFHDEVAPFSVTYKNFLRPPMEGAYKIESPLRVGDHYNGEKSDIPFHDFLLMPTIKKFIGLVNDKLAQQEKIYLFIPAHARVQDRVIIVCGNDEKKTAQVFCTLRDITRAYRNDELDSINMGELVSETLERVRDPSFQTDFKIASRPLTPKILSEMSPERILNLYMQGEDIEAASAQVDDDTGVGRIKFDENLDIESLDGKRKKAFKLLQVFLHDKLDVILTPSPHHHHCVDLTGKKDNVHMAYLIGKRIAPQINDGKDVKTVWLENAWHDAKSHISTLKAQEFMQRNRASTAGLSLRLAG